MKQKNKRNVKQKNKEKKKSLITKLFIFSFITVLIIGISFLTFKIYNFRILTKEMFLNSPSLVFDTNNNLIAEIGSERNRDNVKIEDIPKNLQNAYISIEDQRFFSHHGVDIKRTGAAILSYITKKGTSFGGSTITQQLVKNLTGDDSNTISRKVKEWFYAWTIEAFYSKEEILEAYLNIIYTGPNIYGVKEAAKYYFDLDLNELSLAQSAFIAGINNAPNTYNPFTEKDRTEKIKTRTKTVLSKMLELGYISETEYDDSIKEVDNSLKFNKGEITNNTSIYSYHTDALINEIISDLSKRKSIPEEFATNFLYLSGSHIYSTETRTIQDTLENELKKTTYILPSSDGKTTAQAAMIIIDNKTGEVVASYRRIRRKNKFKSF